MYERDELPGNIGYLQGRYDHDRGACAGGAPENYTYEGIPIALKGHKVSCPACGQTGVIFDPILPKDDNLSLRSELNSLCEKALVMGRAVRNGQSANGFTTPEIEILAEQYLHCSAHWNAVVRDDQGMTFGAVKPAKLVTFTNRPDERWQRTIYDMDGNKIWK